ncbi:MAG: NADPH-dependent FMN reductase [Acidimicrobiia bacterium]
MEPSTHPKIVILAGSVRAGSLNAALADRVAEAARDQRFSVHLLDLADYQMPMYNGDDEATHGQPDGAVRLHDVVVTADILLIASPEFNGGPTPLLKNALDWVSRVSKRPLSGRRIGLMSAAPGRGSGSYGLMTTRRILEHMHADVAESELAIGHARTRLHEDDFDIDNDIKEFLADVARGA